MNLFHFENKYLLILIKKFDNFNLFIIPILYKYLLYLNFTKYENYNIFINIIFYNIIITILIKNTKQSSIKTLKNLKIYNYKIQL